MKCFDCKYYKEVAYKWGECLHYPCMAEPDDPACNEFEKREIDKILDKLFEQFKDTGIVPILQPEIAYGYVNGQFEYMVDEYLKKTFNFDWPQLKAVVYNRTHRVDFNDGKIYKI